MRIQPPSVKNEIFRKELSALLDVAISNRSDMIYIGDRPVATDSQLACTTNPQTHTAIYCTHHPTQNTSRTPSLTRNSLDCDVFVATTLISLRKQRKCASSSRHAVIPIQLSTTANTAHSQSIRNRHHFRHTTNLREESHSHSHFTHITFQSKTSS